MNLTTETVLDYKYSLDIMEQELNSKWICPEIKYALKASIEALGKQIPQRPTHLTVKNDIKIGNFIFHKGCKIYRCKCKEWVGYKDPFCKHCGQKLKWD